MKNPSRTKNKINLEISAGGVVFRKEKGGIKILLIKDSYDRWALPKGKTEKEETMISTALREIREETGLKKLNPIDSLGQVKYFYRLNSQLIFKVVHYFLVESFSKKLAPNEEIKDAQWVSEEEALKRIAYRNTYPILKKACQKIKETKKESKDEKGSH